MSHNNMIPNGHFHKDWQRFVKVWFNQPMRKIRRERARKLKIKKKAPRPIDMLRPIVRCPTIRYHTKQRIGKGFSLKELKTAKINPSYAKTIGIAVDYRRRNKSYETVMQNVQRLKEYLSRLILFPLKEKKQVTETVTKHLNKFDPMKKQYKARKPTQEEIKTNVYINLRLARTEAKRLSRKLKRNSKSKCDILFDDKK